MADDGDLDAALAAPLAWKEAGGVRYRRRASLRGDYENGPIMCCSKCCGPVLNSWNGCEACGEPLATSNRNLAAEEIENTRISTAVALSLADQEAAIALFPAEQEAAPQWLGLHAAVSTADIDVDVALARSFDGLWECITCQALNTVAAQQCASCNVFKTAQGANAAAAEAARDEATAGVTRIECGLPGCVSRAGAGHFGFCSEVHRSRALSRGLLVPAHAHVELQAGNNGTILLRRRRHLVGSRPAECSRGPRRSQRAVSSVLAQTTHRRRNGAVAPSARAAGSGASFAARGGGAAPGLSRRSGEREAPLPRDGPAPRLRLWYRPGSFAML